MEIKKKKKKKIKNTLGTCVGRYGPVVCFEGLGSHSHRVFVVFSRFVRESREISPVPSLYRESNDSQIHANQSCFER